MVQLQSTELQKVTKNFFASLWTCFYGHPCNFLSVYEAQRTISVSCNLRSRFNVCFPSVWKMPKPFYAVTKRLRLRISQRCNGVISVNDGNHGRKIHFQAHSLWTNLYLSSLLSLYLTSNLLISSRLVSVYEAQRTISVSCNLRSRFNVCFPSVWTVPKSYLQCGKAKTMWWIKYAVGRHLFSMIANIKENFASKLTHCEQTFICHLSVSIFNPEFTHLFSLSLWYKFQSNRVDNIDPLVTRKITSQSEYNVKECHI